MEMSKFNSVQSTASVQNVMQNGSQNDEAEMTSSFIISECDCMQPATFEQTAAFGVSCKSCKENIFTPKRKNL